MYFVDRENNYAPICSKKEEYSVLETVEYYEKRLMEEYQESKGIQ